MKSLKIPDNVHTELKVFSAKQDVDNIGFWAMGFILEGLRKNKHKFEHRGLDAAMKSKSKTKHQ